MSVLDRKLKRDLVLSKGMLAAIIAIIAVGSGCLVGMLGTFWNLKSAQISYYSNCRMADFWLDLKKAPVSSVRELQKLKGVSEIRNRIAFPVIVDLENVEKPISGKVITLPDERLPVINGIVLKRGSYFTDGQRDEVIVSEKFAEARNINPGDFIHIVLKGQRKKLFVVGSAISSEFMYLTPPGSIAPDPAGYGVFWIKREYAEDVLGFHGACNNLVGLLTPEAKLDPEPVLNEISERLNSYGVFTATPLAQQESNLSLCSEMAGLQTQATVLPVIFLGVAALALNVVMLRMAEQQRTIIGTLKALGVSNRKIFTHFLKFGGFVGVVGGLGGCLLGYWIAYEMTCTYRFYFTFPKLVNLFYPSVMLFSIFIAVGFSVLGALRGVKAVIRLSPAEAMHPSPPACGGTILLEKWTWFWKKLDFRWQMALRGLFRNKGRTIIGVCASMLGGAILLLAMGLSDSMTYMIVFQFGKILKCDYTMSFRSDVDGGALYEAERLPGVTYVEPQLNVSCNFQNGNHVKKGGITGIIHDAKLTVPCSSDGKPVRVPPVGLLMTKRLAEKLHLGPGDTVRVIPVKGNRTPKYVKIAGIIDTTFGLAVYADYKYLNFLVGEEAAINELQMNARQTPEQKREFFKQVKKYPELSSIGIIPLQKKNIIEDFVAKMKGFTYVMIIFAGVIFFGSILNSALVSLAERQREIATFRVLGYQPLEVGEIFLRETMLVNMIGALLGLPLGYYMLWGMCLQFQNDMYSVPSVIYPMSWIYTLIWAFVFVLGAYLIIQRSINRMDWSEALKMKE